jgi:GxxExxY protein
VRNDKLTHKIIGCAYRVHNKLGFGFLEILYKRAIIIEFEKSNLEFEVEKPMKVHYSDQVIGDFYIDLFVEDKVIVELKSVKSIVKEHEVQLVNYLNGLKIDSGLLINFGPNGVDVKRKFRRPAAR